MSEEYRTATYTVRASSTGNAVTISSRVSKTLWNQIKDQDDWLKIMEKFHSDLGVVVIVGRPNYTNKIAFRGLPKKGTMVVEKKWYSKEPDRGGFIHWDDFIAPYRNGGPFSQAFAWLIEHRFWLS